MNAIIEIEHFQQNVNDAVKRFESKNMKYTSDDKMLTEKEFNITKAPIHSLLNKISTGHCTATETLIAFVKRAIINQEITSITYGIEQAIYRAQYLDKYHRKNGTTMGPLHGLPIARSQMESFYEMYGGITSDWGNVTVDSLNLAVSLEDHTSSKSSIRSGRTMVHTNFATRELRPQFKI
ncbi:hypothetical protein G9P44_005060 [Scheffersomyces stipitis]|nr:hypothetical protein G9P44_005060 [Scheffersomyces stipitis]